jgi:hypothetical protein
MTKGGSRKLKISKTSSERNILGLRKYPQQNAGRFRSSGFYGELVLLPFQFRKSG